MRIRAVTGSLGGAVTLIYSAQGAAPQKTRATLLPLLIVLFIASYAILTMLVVEQGRTIEAQRSLLREMMKDSAQLADLKGKMAQADTMHAQAKPVVEPQKQAKEKVSADPSPKAQKSPTSEVKRQGKSARATKQVPEKPAEDLQDVRRSTNIS